MTKIAGNPIPRLQAVIRNSAPITQNQWYDFWTGLACAAGEGSVKKNIQLLLLSMDQATANEDIELRIIADNLDETMSQTMVAGTNYNVLGVDSPDNAVLLQLHTQANSVFNRAFLLQAHSLQIMYRKTTATGANNTTIKGVYAQW